MFFVLQNRRVKEHEEGCKIQQETEERIAAAVLTQGYIADLIPQVLEGLNESGFIYDNIKAGTLLTEKYHLYLILVLFFNFIVSFFIFIFNFYL